MTEQDAREKVCPFMVDYMFNPNDCIATVYKKCCTSECMSWCWEEVVNKDKPLGVGGFEYSYSTTSGYCKLIKGNR